MFLRLALLPASWLYGILSSLRNWLYDTRIINIKRVAVPVISIGNMTTGGTGKTPLVEYLAHSFSAKGMTVAIVSRGYQRSSKGMQIVSDGRNVLCNAEMAGDEPYQMAAKLAGVAVIVDEDRTRGARFAIANYHPDLILLDDGFQHRRLHRDIDIVLIDGTYPLKEIPMLPAGMRREPLASLRRASLIALTRVDVTLPDWAAGLKSYSSAPTIGVCFQPVRLRRAGSTETLLINSLQGNRCLAFCGIGNPASFRKTVEGMGIDIIDFVPYPDHHRYSDEDFRDLTNRFQQGNAQMVVTTEKDMSRFSSSPLPEFFPAQECYAVEIEATITQGKEVFDAIIDSVTRKAA